jgi:RND family efflux transporter MFP subunit
MQRKEIPLKRLTGWVAGAFVLLLAGCGGEEAGGNADRRQIAPVRVAPVQTGAIEERRVFSGSLEARAEFLVAPKRAGRLVALEKDVADPVDRGEVVARLDNAEATQDVAAAEAELAVAEANLREARNAFAVAERELQRVRTLREREVASDSQFDQINARYLAAESQIAVAEAQLVRARAALESARIQAGYTEIVADWSDRFGNGDRVVAERFVNEGDFVSVGEAIFRIVELDPITGVFAVTERDYSRLHPGLKVSIVADGLPGETFAGMVARVAPVFERGSRQARVEVDLQNPEGRLKPGMFMRAEVVLERRESVLKVPAEALTERGDAPGVFVLGEDQASVRWVPVEIGLRNAREVQITAPAVDGFVVTLGQHLVSDGSPVRLPEGLPAAP